MKSLSFGQDVDAGAAEVCGLLEESRGGEEVGREPLAKEGGAEGFSFAGVGFHQGFQLGCELGHGEAEPAGEIAVGEGCACGRKGRKAILEQGHSVSGP